MRKMRRRGSIVDSATLLSRLSWIGSIERAKRSDTIPDHRVRSHCPLPQDVLYSGFTILSGYCFKLLRYCIGAPYLQYFVVLSLRNFLSACLLLYFRYLQNTSIKKANRITLVLQNGLDSVKFVTPSTAYLTEYLPFYRVKGFSSRILLTTSFRLTASKLPLLHP